MNKRLIFILIGVALAGLILYRCVHQDAGQQKNTGTPTVVVDAVHRENVEDATEALGTARAKESTIITAKVTESVAEVKFRDGQPIKKGETIIILDTREAAAALTTSEANVKQQRQEYDRVRTLVAKKVLAVSRLQQQEALLKEAEAQNTTARTQYDYRVITAPFDGVLGLRKVSPGTLVSPGTEITTLEDINTIQVDFTLPERYITIAKQGLQVEATVAAYRDHTFRGVVIAVDNSVDPNTRAITLRAEITNADFMIKPGMLLNVHVMEAKRDALTVPEEALLAQKDKQFVMLVGPGGKVTQQEVKVGQRFQHLVEMLSGVKEGDLVIVEGLQKAKPGQTVNVKRQDAGERK